VCNGYGSKYIQERKKGKMNIWDDLISRAEKDSYFREGMGELIGFGNRPAIVVVDMCKAFVEPGHPMAGPTAILAAKNIKSLLEKARNKEVLIVYTTLPDISDISEHGYWKAKTLKDKLIIEGDGRDIYPILQPYPREVVLEKCFPSAFFGTHLLSMLIYHQIDTVIVVGAITSGCVRATAIDAFSYNYRVIVPVECVCDRSQMLHKVALFELHMKHADVVSDEVIHKYIESL
jgi:maleamate amidohydrolase